MKFSDGMQFDTSGELRIVQKSDGLYVVGKGMLCAISSYDEGRQMIASMTQKDDQKGDK